jgi:alkanesulfonate monooxygenase SsuD/methylene tetrahydromethanopterin reductase-like flavin-dependent oxidoreductase (luciferase family)
LKFSIFDHVDRSDRPLARQFDERLEFVAAADRLGFYCYHVAEHHATPLNMVPVPGVFLGAVARATTRIKLGPLVYLLPLYSPLRLIEEVGMLDHLSHGRLEIGVGRGVSPYELNFHKVDPESSREIFIDAFDVLLAGMTNDRLNHKGPYFSYANVPMELRPLQRPHPCLWYGSSNAVGSQWAGERGLHFSTLGPVVAAKGYIDTFRAALAKRGGPLIAKPEFPGGTVVGINRSIVVADTDEEAMRIAQPAYDHWYANLTKLERENVAGPKITKSMFADAGEAVRRGTVFVGSPATVRAAIAEQVAELGVNYMSLAFYFGSLSHEHAMRSLNLFATEVMPKLEHL